MAESDRLSSSLQESVLTLLCLNDHHGAVAAGLLKPEHFEPPYADIAARALEYRKRFGKAPGDAHLDDLFDHVLADPKNRLARTYRQILGGIIEQARGLNAEYVASRVTEFVRRQTLKGAVLNAAQRYQQGGDNLITEVEGILFDALKLRTDNLDAGVFLNDRLNNLSFLDHTSAAYLTGIPALDRRQIGLTPKELFLFMAPPKAGKSWWMVYLGKMALLQNAKIVHISLEMSEERLLQRYFQALFAVAKRPDEFKTTAFEFDALGRMSGLVVGTKRPKLDFSDPDIRKHLNKRVDEWGLRLGGLVVKQFPTKALTIAKLNAYLDGLEHTFRFIPTVLLIDYPDLMWTDKNNPRTSLGRTFEEVRGIMVERNLAGGAPTQTNREGSLAAVVGGQHVSEDFSKIMTADNVVSYNQTKDERALNLARLYVDRARNDEDKFSVLISQSYTTGQFVTSSTRMPSNYFEKVKEVVGRELAEDPGDGE